jgi:hypothetical protein
MNAGGIFGATTHLRKKGKKRWMTHRSNAVARYPAVSVQFLGGRRRPPMGLLDVKPVGGAYSCADRVTPSPPFHPRNTQETADHIADLKHKDARTDLNY